MASRAPALEPGPAGEALSALEEARVGWMGWVAGWRAVSIGCSTIATIGGNPGRRLIVHLFSARRLLRLRRVAPVFPWRRSPAAASRVRHLAPAGGPPAQSRPGSSPPQPPLLLQRLPLPIAGQKRRRSVCPAGAGRSRHRHRQPIPWRIQLRPWLQAVRSPAPPGASGAARPRVKPVGICFHLP